MMTRRTVPLVMTESLVGVAIWAGLATLAGMRRAPLGVIELLFLFAPLVIVPLVSELVSVLDPPGIGRKPFLRGVQSVSALAACVAFWIPTGRLSAVLSSWWLLWSILLVWLRLNRQWRSLPLRSWPLNIAYADLVLGAAWFVVSRAGWRPIGFQEPIILLTAVHFHYSGFATAVLGAATLRFVEEKRMIFRWLRGIVLLAVCLPFAVAAGFVFSPLLRLIAAWALAVTLAVLAGIFVWLSGQFRRVQARVYLRSAAGAAFAAFMLVGLYATSEYLHRGWITVPGMANSHGVLNGLGFVLLATLAWLIELETASDGIEELHSFQPHHLRRGVETQAAFKKPEPVPSPFPEFVATRLLRVLNDQPSQ